MKDETLTNRKKESLRRNMVEAALRSASESGLRFIEAAETTFPETSDQGELISEHEAVLKEIALLKPHVLKGTTGKRERHR